MLAEAAPDEAGQLSNGKFGARGQHFASRGRALVDYVNFKGEGVLSTERYRGQGWVCCRSSPG